MFSVSSSGVSNCSPTCDKVCGMHPTSKIEQPVVVEVAAGTSGSPGAKLLRVASAATPAVQLGMVFFAAAENNPFADPRTNNVFQTLNARVSDASASHREELVEMLRALVRVAGVPVMMDAVLETSDQEYLEAIALRAALSRP